MIFFHSIQHQNAVFCDDADDHYHAHQAYDVQCRPRNKQRKQHAAKREHRSGNNCDRVRKRPKLDQQHNKNQGN